MPWLELMRGSNGLDHRSAFISYRDDARTALEYLRHYRSGILAELSTGEAVDCEFKSTLRWNIRAGRNDDEITHSVLKSIAAFLNTNGGRLFIGVDDSGRAVGIDVDGFPNTDKFTLFLISKIRDTMGSQVAAEIGMSFHDVGRKTICRLTCPASKVPIFLKTKEEEFFIRTGPSSSKLPTSQVIEYVSRRFPTSAP